MAEEELTHYEQSIAYMKGQVAERERIIAILNHEYWHNTSHLSGIHYDCLMCEAIALIKERTDERTTLDFRLLRRDRFVDASVQRMPVIEIITFELDTVLRCDGNGGHPEP